MRIVDIARTASPKTLLRRAGTLRPSLNEPRPNEVGYLLGTARGRQVWATVEDSILLIGPPRSGKGLHLVINAIVDAPGPVITTSTRCLRNGRRNASIWCEPSSRKTEQVQYSRRPPGRTSGHKADSSIAC